MTVHIGQTEVPSCVAVGKFFVVESKEVENRRVQIMDVNDIFHGFETEFVGRAVNVSAFDAAACQPH